MADSEVRPAVDWFQIITDLSRHGLKAKTIAIRIDVPRSTLLGWKQGAEPRWSEGQRLIDLWCATTGQTVDRLPKVTLACWWAYHAK